MVGTTTYSTDERLTRLGINIDPCGSPHNLVVPDTKHAIDIALVRLARSVCVPFSHSLFSHSTLGMSKASSHESYDKENGVAVLETEVYTVEDAPDQVIAKRFGSFGPLLSKLFNSGVEARGVERVPEEQRENKNFWNRSVDSAFTRIRTVRLSSVTVYLCGGMLTLSILFRASPVK